MDERATTWLQPDSVHAETEQSWEDGVITLVKRPECEDL